VDGKGWRGRQDATLLPWDEPQDFESGCTNCTIGKLEPPSRHGEEVIMQVTIIGA
jgi:hypothetical protein